MFLDKCLLKQCLVLNVLYVYIPTNMYDLYHKMCFVLIKSDVSMKIQVSGFNSVV